MSFAPELVVASSDDELAALGAELLGRAIDAAVRARGRALVALSGGSTPGPVYRALTELSLPWRDVVFAWVDERAVPPHHPRSNYRAAAAELDLDGALRAASTLRMRGGEAELEAEARRYEASLRALFGVARAVAFDAVVLGVGDDGHTASLFPGTGDVEIADRLVAAIPARPERGLEARLTLTAPVLREARLALVLAKGASKRPRLEQALTEGPLDEVPARLVREVAGHVAIVCDQAAAPAG